MRTLARFTLGIALAFSISSCERAGSMEATAAHLGAEGLTSLRYSGSGANFSVGQPFHAGGAWPQVNIVSYNVAIDYGTGSMRTEMVREQPVPEPVGGGVRFPGQQTITQFVSGSSAWNMPAAAPDGSAPQAQPQPGAVAERMLQIWTTPQGFIKAAMANGATVTETETGSDVAFTLDGKYRVTGAINLDNEVERVVTWIDNPVMGDTPVETSYWEYQELGGLMFPTRILQTQGGQTSLDLTINLVEASAAVDILAPENVAGFQPPPVQATVERVGNGIHYVRGGSHHSVAIEMSDHVVVVEGPQSEERALAVIAAIGEAIPNKPIRYVVNTHVHFDHSGGLRPFVDAGATVVTHESNQAFYESAWAAPRTLNPDRLAQSGTAPTFIGVGDQGELTDGRRTIELHRIADNTHAVGFLMAYLPQERLLIEADAFTPGAEGAPPPATPSVNTVALLDNVERLGLDVREILALHGPRIATLADLRTAAGR